MQFSLRPAQKSSPIGRKYATGGRSSSHSQHSPVLLQPISVFRVGSFLLCCRTRRLRMSIDWCPSEVQIPSLFKSWLRSQFRIDISAPTFPLAQRRAEWSITAVGSFIPGLTGFHAAPHRRWRWWNWTRTSMLQSGHATPKFHSFGNRARWHFTVLTKHLSCRLDNGPSTSRPPSLREE
jgi:hypothetical protein